MPISRAQSSFDSAGFSLIELIVALSILSLIAGLVVPAFARALERAQFETALRQISNHLKLTRRHAISEFRESVFLLDTARGAAWIDGEPVTLAAPGDAVLSLTIAATERQSTTAGGIRFFADGSSTGGTIELHDEHRARSISVDWLTGRLEQSE
jgi:general secretion pathway protein H